MEQCEQCDALAAKLRDAESGVRDLERAMTEFQTSPEMAARWASHGAAAERAAIVAWLRDAKHKTVWTSKLAAAIERGEHHTGAEVDGG